MVQQQLKTIISTENSGKLTSLVKEYLSLGWVVYKNNSDHSIELSFTKIDEAKFKFYQNGLMKIYSRIKKNGVKHGVFISFYESGNKQEEKYFNNGETWHR